MAWRGLKHAPQYFSVVIGLAAVILAIFWLLKLLNIQRLKAEIVQLEAKMGKGQEVWRDYPPLTQEERKDLQRARERLIRTLPRDKDIPSLLQEISRLAREYNLANVSFNTGEGASALGAGQAPAPTSGSPQVVAPQPTPPVSPAAPESSGPIASFPLKVAFAGDYREIAYFLEALQRLPRLVTIQSLQLQRSLPLVAAEVILQAYYQKGSLSVTGK